MVVAVCLIELELHGVQSLKAKRSLLKPLLARLPHHFNVAVAEIDHQDSWHTATLGVATLGNDAALAHRTLEKVVAWIETQRPDLPIAAYAIEFR